MPAAPLAVICCWALLGGGGDARGGEIAPGEDGFRGVVAPFFEAHCVRCHGEDKSKGRVTLHDIGGDLVGGDEQGRWERVLDVLSFGEMPPEGEPQPDEAERQAMVGWIEAGLREHLGRDEVVEKLPTARRLTNVEYQNTMRDLFGIDLHLIDDLPEDPAKPYHFNNSPEFMRMGPEQLEAYRASARRMLASAIVDPGEPEVHRSSQSFSSGQPHEQGIQADEVGVYGNRVRSAAHGMGLKSWPETGEFRIVVRAAAILPPGYEVAHLRVVMGYPLNENSSTLRIEPVGDVELRNRVDQVETYEFRGRIENYPVRPARGTVAPVLHVTPQNLFDNGQLNDNLAGFDNSWQLTVPRVVVQQIDFEAPVTDVWPPEHHTRILFDSPLRDDDPAAYVREVITRFLPRAFRRPVTAEEIDPYVDLYGLIQEEAGSMEEAMRETLAMVLISPQFLYHLVDGDDEANRPFELASRLSYFLWRSMPDGELMRLAESGELCDPETIGRQVTRMLADGRSRAFVDDFASQWLSIDKVHGVSINRDLFPRFLYLVHLGERAGEEVPYRPTIRDYMREETVGFVEEVIRRNESVLRFVDSDFAYLNEPLAAHYGVGGVRGNLLRPVAIRAEDRLGGLLTQGSFLVGNSTGSAPHPIYRAVWLREAILGDEVAPPPAEVPALSDTAGEEVEDATSIAEMLRMHRQVESCNDCHVRLDPWGIPFEEYNAIGQFQPWAPEAGTRVRKFSPDTDIDLDGYAGYLASIRTVEVDATARVPHGPEVSGVRELKDYLIRERGEEIAENMVRRLLSFGLGRGLTYQDRFVVEELLDRAEEGGYRMHDLVRLVCQSEIFRGGAHHITAQ